MHGYPTDLLCDSTSRGCPWLTTSPPSPPPPPTMHVQIECWLYKVFSIRLMFQIWRQGGWGSNIFKFTFIYKITQNMLQTPPPWKTQITFGPPCKNFWIHTPHMSNGLILWKVQHSFRWTETLHMFKQEITKFFPNIATYIFFFITCGVSFLWSLIPSTCIYVYILINFYKVTKI